jgi:protein-S-isoprenylcysteine O-methyltransferase Ste14
MADNLNKTRMRDTTLLVVLAILSGIFCSSYINDHAFSRGLFRTLGLTLAAFCAVGRVYSSAFIGGVKNAKLVTDGPYSVCRNPLYFSSLMGALGVGLMTAHILPAALLFGGFLYIYNQLIDREENFLQEKFGQEFTDYKARTPRLWPAFRHFSYPDEMLFQPRFLTKALADAIWWVAPAILFQITDLLKIWGFIKPVFTIL